MKAWFIILLVSCGLDVHVMKIPPKDSGVTDSSDLTIDTDTSVTDTSAPENIIEGVGGYVNYYLRQVACPACVGENQELLVEFKTKFHEPTNDYHTSWIPEVGTCTNQLLITVPSVNLLDVGPQVFVDGPMHSFVATQAGVGEHYAYLYETQYDRNGNHMVSLMNYPETFNFQSIEGFDYIEPWNMFYVDPSYAFDAAILRNGMTFTWSPYGSSGVFMVTIAAYNSTGTQLLGYAACTSPDQGFMTFPGNYLTGFPPYSLAVIHLARHQVTMIPYVPLNSYIESHMEWEVVGTGYLE